MRAVSLSRPRDQSPHWLRVCVNALIMLGVVAMLNLVGATSEPIASGSSHDVTMTHAQTPGALAEAPGRGHHPALVVPADDGGMSMEDCCGLVMLCIAMIAGMGAFAFLGRRSIGRMMWQVPRPHTFSLGQVVAPFHIATPLQRTAVLRL